METAEQDLTFSQRLKRARDARYACLKNNCPTLYDKAIRAAGTIQCNHMLGVECAAAIEDALICMALEAIDEVR